MGSSSKTEEDAHPNRSSQSTFWGQKLKHEKALAHHMANVYRNVGGFIQLAVAGQPLPALTIKDIHDRNAEQAAQATGVGRAGTLELLRQNGADTAALLRTLSDAQLDTATVFLGYPMTVESLAQNGLVGHTEEHLASIQSAAASAERNTFSES